ncbi:hypothetical protein B0H63DRAFT_518092 [Podospora didyma]|uniref:Uncharacterized protein n=1 Tax=Podospora didyma TaxID=330526 RepID=A0AAE0P802_9PEZI|nr:hypothetical protein B0H63DRAFT_518092 [Podospora didyma]
MSHLIGPHLRRLHHHSAADTDVTERYATRDDYPPWKGGVTMFCSADEHEEEPVIPSLALFKTLTPNDDDDDDDDDDDGSITNEDGAISSDGVPSPSAPSPSPSSSPLLSVLPTVGECAVHLELLESFFALRRKVLASAPLDEVFEVPKTNRTVFRVNKSKNILGRFEFTQKPYKLKDTNWPAERKKKWPLFIGMAVQRFKAWIETADADKLLLVDDGGGFFRLRFLPPLGWNGKLTKGSYHVDVLMVWHAFLLNPKDFVTFCANQQLERIRHVHFPWAQIHSALDTKSDSYHYSLPEDAQDWFRSVVGFAPDLFVGLVLATPGSVERPTWIAFEDQQLAENVHRQAGFVDKMHRHLWIRSPAAQGTLTRAVSRYDKFLRLLGLYRTKMLVPTLDIDLVWHTHQLSAARYEADTRARTGSYVNHDDKLGKPVLHDSLGETQGLFYMRFGEQYSICLCWDCEAVVSVLEERDAELEGDVMKLAKESIADMRDLVLQEVEYFRHVECSRRSKAGRYNKKIKNRLPVRRVNAPPTGFGSSYNTAGKPLHS